jgi:hypothetical protein
MECALVNFVPMTEAQVNEFNRLTIPNERARAGWRLNREKILELMDHLGIEHPVSFRLMKGKYRYGTHYARTNAHRITLNQDRNAKDTNHTLLHELAHVWQAEDWARKTGKSQTDFYRHEYMAYGGHGELYKTNPYEVLANDFADRMEAEGWVLITESSS